MLLFLLACNKGSSTFATGDLSMAINAYNAGDGQTLLQAQLAAPFVTPGYVRLDGGDRLVAAADDDTTTDLDEVMSATRAAYVATLGDVGEVTITLDRGDSATTGTVLPIPDAFTLLHPDPYSDSWTPGDDLPIQWDNTTDDEMDVGVAGTCFTEAWTQAGVTGDGVVVSGSDLAIAPETDGCSVQVVVDRSAQGTPDPDLKTVTAVAVQERVATLVATEAE
jgi:hypothetical protein